MRKALWVMVFSIILIMFMSCDFSSALVNGSGEVIGEERTILTPYPSLLSSDTFYSGATYDLPSSSSQIYSDLKTAKEEAYLNTITVYGLENKSLSYRDALFNALDRLDMKIVVRIESYDGSTFAFRNSDAASVVSSYSSLIEYVSDSSRRGRIAYLALNMPVDDTAVQNNSGGINSTAWKNAQVEYAEEFVRLMREELKKHNAESIPLYLSIFYGWQNDFDIPSYASANADGYFMNNYSYPKNFNYSNYASNSYDSLPSASMSDSDLINANRLAISLNTFRTQYGTNVPLVMEWGIHTAEYNNQKATQQSAGLVKDLEAKERALKATYDFYRDNYSFVRGFLYFGYNLYKEEGNPAAVMDWCLKY